MGRKKLGPHEKKTTVSVRIPDNLIKPLNDINNKSKFFELLLNEYFNMLK